MNTPVPGVTLPIATACKPPVVAVVSVVAPVTPKVELAVNVVNAPEPGVALPIATACNPPVVAVLNVPVVNVPAAGVTLPTTP